MNSTTLNNIPNAITRSAITLFVSKKKYMASPMAAKSRNRTLSATLIFVLSNCFARFFRMRSTCSSSDSSSCYIVVLFSRHDNKI